MDIKSRNNYQIFYNAASGMIANCVKLVSIVQPEGQEFLFSMQPLIRQLVAGSLHPDLNKAELLFRI